MGEQDANSDFDRLVAELQREIWEEERALYSEKVIQLARHPRNVGRMEEPDAQGVVHGWCGDTMEIYLRLDGERIEEATFLTDGCGPSVACGVMLTDQLKGMMLNEAEDLSPKELLDVLGGLPKESEHCAELAVKTLWKAIAGVRAEGHRTEEEEE